MGARKHPISHIHIVPSCYQFLSEELKAGSRILSMTSNNVLCVQRDMGASVRVRTFNKRRVSGCPCWAACFPLHGASYLLITESS